MMNSLLYLRLLPSFILFSLPIEAALESLSLERVLESTMKYSPQVLESLEKVKKAQAKVLSGRGGFDTKLTGKAYAREGGKYEGGFYEAQVKKPLGPLGTEIYTGYRQSQGQFPVYEGKVTTLDDGEVMAGLSLSLLQNRSIDQRRLKLWTSEFDFQASELKNKSTQLKIKKQASLAYYQWVTEGKILEVEEGLLKLALEREEGLRKRIQKGDLAQLYLSENQQYIVKRKTRVEKAKANFMMASLTLSLFWRNQEGNPQFPVFEVLPQTEEVVKDMIREFSLVTEPKNFSLNSSFYLQMMKTQLSNLELESSFRNNQFLPKVDFKYEVMRDYGEGTNSLNGTDHKFYLGIEIPLERRKLRGEFEQVNAQKRILNYEVQLAQNEIKNKIDGLFYKLQTARKILDNTITEVELGVILENAERKKFFSGASDFFVVNIREQNTADARIKRMEAYYSFFETLTLYREITQTL